MFPHYICENIDILAVMMIQKNSFCFHCNQKTQGSMEQLIFQILSLEQQWNNNGTTMEQQWNNLYFKY